MLPNMFQATSFSILSNSGNLFSGILCENVQGKAILNSRFITKRKESEKRISRPFEQVDWRQARVDRHALQSHQVSQEIIIAQEKERQRVACELHDEAGQALTVLKVSLELLLADLSKAGFSEAQAGAFCQRLGAAISLCEKTMSQIRLLAHDLHPAALEDLGLNLALEGFCSDFCERTHLPITYTGIDTPALPDTAQICLYRFLQEGLTNVVKHAHASQVWVTLHFDAHQVILTVKDDGIGINLHPQAASNNPHGIGLIGLKERLAMLGGKLEIISHSEKGTCLAAFVPYEAGNEPDQQDSSSPGR
jgi:signal transduction histidine kinase